MKIWKNMSIEGTALLARAICHELDHLDGHMYTEKVEGELCMSVSSGRGGRIISMRVIFMGTPDFAVEYIGSNRGSRT